MKRRVCLSVLLLFFFTIYNSCSWFTSNDDNEISFTITGKLITNGAMPQNYDEAMNARTALATAPSGKTIQYKVLLLAAEGDTEPVEGAVSEVASDGSSYSIKYTGSSDETAQYYLRAVAYYMDGTSEVDVLVSPDTPLDNAVNLKIGTFSKDLEMRPATTGSGKADLTITLQAPGKFTTASISDTTNFELDLTDISSGTIKIKNKGTNISAGSYNVTVSFYKSQTINSVATDVLVYQFDDVINIFNNLTTNKWVDNGNSPHLSTGSLGTCSCHITDAMLADFASTNFYVNKDWTGQSKGTYAEPFSTLNYALKYIDGIGNNTYTYTIHVKENETVESVGLPFIDIDKKIKIEVYKTIPGKKDGTYQLNSGASASLLNITENGELTLESDGTGGLVLSTNVQSPTFPLISISGKMVMYGGKVVCNASRDCGAISISNNSNALFEMYGGLMNKNTSGPLITFEGTNGNLKVSKKPYIYKNTTTGNLINVSLPAGKTIQVVGPLKEGALIGVTAETEPTITGPVTITTGYGYQTGGYNAGVKPGRYFRGDAYGVTEDSMLESPAGEAVLALSGGSLSTKIKDDITIEIDHTNASKSDKVFTFKVIKNKGSTDTNAPEEDITSATGISYSYTLKDHTDVIAESGNYTKNKNTLTLGDSIPQGRYTLNVSVNYQGNNYSSNYNITYVDVTAPEGCVAVLGDTWNSAATLCADDDQRKSNFFIAGRKLTIPNLIASDHEVTQAEYEMYMTYSSGDKPTQTSAQKSTYPVYWVNWYSAMIYCNLRTLDDDTFGDTREERLAHCVYSFNGEKDPELWLNSNISGTSIYKSSGKFYNSASSNTTTLQNLEFNMDADGWRLPLDVEWEYLARGGNLLPQNQTPYSGSDSMNEVSWNAKNSGDDETNVNRRIHEIKTRKPNNLKIYDMSGNISEWCQDWSLWDGTQNTGIQVDTPITGLTITEALGTIRKSERGGHWDAANAEMKINLHLPSKAFQKYKNIGFRVVRTVLE